MKKFVVLAAAAALMLSTAAAAPASPIDRSDQATTQSPKSSVAKASRVLVYRCWAYDTAGGNWFGTHQILWRARSNAMTMCRNNDAYAAVCYPRTGPCEELYF